MVEHAAAIMEAEACAAREARAAQFASLRDRYAAWSRRVSHGRVVAFLGAIGGFLWAEVGGPGAARAGVPAGIVLAGAFLALLAVHRRVETRRRWYTELWRLNREAVHRIRREWHELRPPRQGASPGEKHPYADDLDVFGHASLFQLLGVVGTAPGRSTLSDWLLHPAPPHEIPDRQAAVQELVRAPDFTDELSARGRIEGEASAGDVERFLAWAEGEPWLQHRPVLIWTTRLLPAVTLTLIGVAVAGLMPPGPALVGLLVHLGISYRFAGAARAAFDGAFAREGVFRHDARLFHQLTARAFEAPLLKRLQNDLSAGGITADAQMRRLSRLMSYAEVRYSPGAYLIVQLLVLWDFHVLSALERWQRENGRHIRIWLATLGRFDALSALAALARDHPGWAFPEIAAGEPAAVRARTLAHPLLRPSTARSNDVEVGPPGSFLLVTGSNMSGKSTLLRAIGTNVVLAQAGGPVCAAWMRLTPVTLQTSMRVQDSLEEGVSFFMAELQRLKSIVDAARTARTGGASPLLYLLDEILQGTNTAERQVAARRIVRHLLDQGAIGAVTTHDLALAEASNLAGAARLVHFRETIERRDGRVHMSFDYRLRPGIATSTNALALMESVGLGLPETD